MIRRPGARLVEGLVSGPRASAVNYELALEQWLVYGETLLEHGWETIEIEPADHCPDAVFVEDTVVVYRNVAVLTRPGAEARRPEVPATRACSKPSWLDRFSP